MASRRRIISQRYQSGDFCRATRCPKFKEIEKINPGDKKKRSQAKARLCVGCKAREFHKYLENHGYALVRTYLQEEPDPDTDAESDKKKGRR